MKDMAEEDKLRTYLKRVTVDLADARTRLAEADAQRHEPLAVIGMSCRYPGADDVESFWDLLAEGRGAALDDVPDGRFDLDPFVADHGVYTKRGAFLRDIAGWDASFFDSPALEAMRMDPQQRLLLELTWEALEDAGTAPPSLRGSRTGVIVGFSDVFQYGQLQLGPDGTQAFTDPYTAQGSAASVAAGRLAYAFDLRGPAMVVDTACSSSLVAVHVAANALRAGECDLAVAAAASLVIKPQMYVNACAASMLSRDGVCQTFDEKADGYVMGEGGGVVVLERLSDALRAGRRIHAVIRGTAVNQDGRSNGLTAPNRSAQVDVIRRALAAARVSPEEIDYVEAHGSGTRLGDAIELGALGDVFGGRGRAEPVLLGAVKTNIGHTQAAAGMAGLIKAALVLQHKVLPPNLNMTEPNKALAGGNLRPSAAAQPLGQAGRPHLAGVSSFGWAGTNAHVVVEAAPDPDPASGVAGQPALPELLPVSAAGPEALRAHLGRLGAVLAAEGAEGAPFADVVHTLQTGRAALGRRRAVVAGTAAEAAGLLKLAADADPDGVTRVEGTPRVAFLLPGVGDQYRGLGRGLYRDEPVFAAAVDRCLAAAADRCGVDLRPMFAPAADDREAAAQAAAGGGLAALLGRAGAPDPAADPDHHARTAHLFLFTVEYALAQLLARRGVTPDLLIGYSLGEYVAACLAGVFSLDDALWVVAERARLIEAMPEGRMLAAAAGPAEIEAVLEGGDDRVDVAALNGPAMTVLSGTPEAVDALAARLAEHGVTARPLRSAHAFHSSLLAPARAELAAAIAKVRRAAPTTPIVSNVTGELLTADQATDPQYWAEHLCRPVRFADAARYAAAQGIDAFVELGAGQTLGGLLRQNTGPQAAAAVLGTLPAQWPAEDRADERATMLQTCGRLWELGSELDWDAVRAGGGRLTRLPAYPFQRTRYWPPAGEAGVPARRTAPAASDLCYAPVWQPDRVRLRDEGTVPAGPLAVFADADGVGTALADLAEAGGAAVVEIVPGDGYRHEGRRVVIDPARPEHYREALAALAARSSGPVRVVHLWSLRDPARTPVFASDDELRTAVRHGFDSLLLTLQALAETAAERGVSLLTGTAGCAEIVGGDGTTPDRALAHGLAHAVRAEYRGLAWHGVDLDPADPPARAAAHLAEELRRGPWSGDDPAAEPALVGRRRGRRWTKGWAPVALDPMDPMDPMDRAAGTAGADARQASAGGPEGPWRPDGTYLITGGTRGLGLGLARHLVRRGVRRLALVGRTDLAEAARRDPEGPATASVRAIAELRAAGAEVLPLTADAGEPDELRRALRECREHFGALTGVVHAAGVPAGGLAERLTRAGAARVLGPKVAAMGPLAELAGPGTPPGQRPELIVLYSSAITVFGGLGEGDYSAANSVLDAYADALAATAPDTRVLSVAWGPWQHDDWQGDGDGGEFARRVREYREVHGFADEAGCAFLDRLTAADGAVVALRQPLPDGLRAWAALTDLDALAGATPAAGGGARFPRPQLRAEYVAPRSDLESVIAESWGGYLGIDRVGVHDPFFDLGGNSLVGMAMVASLADKLGRRIAPAVLFEHPTVAAFAAALAEPGTPAPGTAAPAAASGTGSARGARRRRARATQIPTTRK
jgi:acyl transferase domain-containing protein